jgi:hypothetical protein
MLLIGSSIKVAPVVEWDGQKIGDGQAGTDHREAAGNVERGRDIAQDQLVAVPYEGV